MKFTNNNLILLRIRQQMQVQKLSQKELAKRLGAKQSNISNMFRGKKGYPLTTDKVKSICEVMNLDYDKIISVSTSENEEDITGSDDDYEKDITLMVLDKRGVFINHVKVCNSKVFYCNKYTNYLFSSGRESYTSTQFASYESKITKDLEKNGLEGEFDEYYELEYRGITKTYSVKQYQELISSINEDDKNRLRYIFSY